MRLRIPWTVLLCLLVSAGAWGAAPRYALQFDGDGDYVVIPHDPSLSFEYTESFTIECWFRTSEVTKGYPGGRAIVEKWGGCEYRYPHVIRVHVDPDRWQYGGVEVASFDGVSNPAITSKRRGLNDGLWHHVAFVRCGTQFMKLYVDGVHEGRVTSGLVSNTIENTCPVYIAHHGDWPVSGARDFNGAVDEVRVWRIVRSRASILSTMNTHLTGAERGLVGYWDLDEGTGAAVHDRHLALPDAWLVGTPQWIVSGVCPNHVPQLDWVAGSGYGTDGVRPDEGRDGARFTFKVCYSDADNDAPANVRLWLIRGGVPVAGSPVDMAQQRPGDRNFANGAAFVKHVRLPAGDYTYRFSAADRWEAALGAPTAWTSGPTVHANQPPTLAWLGSGGYTGDGVEPDSGPSPTRFVWKVKYRDADGDRASCVRLRIFRNGSLWRVHAMQAAGGDPATGQTYRFCRSLFGTANRWAYNFIASDGRDRSAVFPVPRQPGPEITDGGAALALTGVTAQPANVGCQLTFSLSAPASTTARVLNMAGRPVAALCRDRGCDAGLNVLLWSGRTETGPVAPAGPYLLEVTAQTDDGAQARALAAFHVRR